MDHGVSLYWVCHWTLRRYSMILQEDPCKHIRSKAANGDDGIHVPHGVLNGVCTHKGYKRLTILLVAKLWKQGRSRKWCQKTNSEMVPETWRPLPLCVHCAHPVSQRLSTSLNVSQHLSTSLNVSQRLSTSLNVSQRLPTSLNVSQRLSTSLNVSQRLSTSLNVSQRLSTSLNVSQRVQVVQKGTSQAQRVGWGVMHWLVIIGHLWQIGPAKSRQWLDGFSVPSNYIGTYPWYCTCIVYKLYICICIYKQYIYILANIFQYSVVPILSLHLRIQPGFNIAGCGRQIEGHPAMSQCCMMSYAYCI